MVDGDERRASDASVARSLEITTTADECMENLVQKLHLLNFRKGFGESKYGRHRAQIHRSYFSVSSPGRSQTEQLYCFVNLAAWLMHDYAGIAIKPVKEGADASAAIAQLLETLKQLRFALPTTLTAAKLQNGFGREVCGVLDGLADLALESTGTRLVPYQHSHDDNDERDVELADVNVAGDMMEGALMPQLPLEDKADGVDMLTGLQATKAVPQESTLEDVSIIGNVISREEWEMETQQVAPQLQIRLPAEARDWRTNLEGAAKDRTQIDESWKEAKASLSRVCTEITEHLQKVETRERFLNNEFASRTDEYRNKKEIFTQKQEAHENEEAEVNDTTGEVLRYTELIEEMHEELAERSTPRTDGGPASKIKNALHDLEEEMKQMDLQMGVIRHQLLHVRLKEQLQAGTVSAQ